MGLSCLPHAGLRNTTADAIFFIAVNSRLIQLGLLASDPSPGVSARCIQLTKILYLWWYSTFLLTCNPLNEATCRRQ
jgi:hypothetical protein